MKKQTLLLLLILIMAAFFRFWQLGQVPPSPSLDEVSIGYNAFSILKTGQDEYGYRLPVLLRAYDDWRPALYVYLTIPFVKIMGLTPAAVRMAAAFLGLLTVGLTFFLAKGLFRGQRGTTIGLIASFLLAISPWHIYLSRLGHEVGAGLTFSVLAIFFFLKWVNTRENKQTFWIILSSVTWAASFYTYQSQKIFVPVILLVLTLIFLKTVVQRKRQVLLALIIGLVVMIPIIKVTFTPEGMARFQGASILANLPETDQVAKDRVFRDRLNQNYFGRYFDHPVLANGQFVLRAYLSHFDPVWLFFNKLNERHKVPSFGHFHLWELPLMLSGFYQLIKSKNNKQAKWLIVAWLLVGPLSSALATQAPHGMRALNALPMPQLLSALGVLGIVKVLNSQKKAVRPLVAVLVLGVLIFNSSRLYHNYFFNFPHEQSTSFQYPLAEAVKHVLTIGDQYDQIVFSKMEQAEFSYMYYLFFSQTDPQWYLNQGGTQSGGFDADHQFGKYQFRAFDWKKETESAGDGKTLFIGNAWGVFPDIPKGVAGLKTFETLDGKLGIKIAAY